MYDREIRSGNAEPTGTVSVPNDAMTNYSFTKIDVPAAAGTYTYIGVSGLDASGDAVGYYGNVDGDGDGTYHGFIALTGNGSGITLDPPGSTNTGVGINASGILFGDYTYLNHQYGFVDNGGVFTTFDDGIEEPTAPSVPLAISTDVDGVTSAGVVYGDYADYVINNGNQPGWQGFLNNNGVITLISFPGANITTLAGINAAGTIVGNYEIGGNTNAGSIGHGFVDSNGSFTAIDVPGAYATSVVGISDGGEIVGNYQDFSNNTHGFVDNNGVITTINIAGATSVGVSAVNAAGEVVGYYADGAGNIHGFVDQNGVITTVDVPGATETDILSVNASGMIAGYYNDSHNNQHGFVGAATTSLVNDNPLSIEAGATKTITSSLLSAAGNVGSDAELQFTVTTAPADGTLLLNGVATTSFTQADIDNGLLSYQETAGGSATSDSFHFTVTDGITTAAGSLQIAINEPPVVTIPSTVLSANAGETLPASSLFSATDANGDTLTYTLYDDSPGASSGHFVVNGTVVPADTPYVITAAQLAQTTFVAGAAGTSDDLYVRAFDGQSYSNNGTYSYFHINTIADQPPVVTIPSTVVSATTGETFSASSLFSATDPDGNPLTYTLYDDSPDASSGHFVVNGTIVPADTAYVITAAQLAQTTFVAGAAGTSDDLYVRAFDGQEYSNNGTYSYFHVNTTSPDHAPVVTIPATVVAASAGESLAASSLFSATDADGDTLTYTLYDDSAAANSGYFDVNGTIVPADTAYSITAAQLAQTTFVAGAAGTSDDLYVRAFDGQEYSNNGTYSYFHVNTTAAPDTLSLQYKGFDYVAFYNGAYENSDSLASLAQTGANSIEATLDYGIDVATSQVVADPNYTDSLTALGNTIAQAENLGLSVMVRPLIDFLNPAEVAPYSVGEWRQDYQPTNVAAFFASYQQMIVQEAQVAQANGAQMLSIGAELDQLAGPQYLSYWTDIINAVRQVFTGALTYSASWNTASEVSFWGQLNYEGIDNYVPLSNAANPTVQDLVNGWLNPATEASNPGAFAVIGNQSPVAYFENLSAQSGKPLLFTELGYANDSGAAADPSASGNSPDPTLQADLYQAFFQAWTQAHSSALVGTYFWEWDPNGSSSNVGPNIDSFSPQNSPALAQITAGFAAVSVPADTHLVLTDATHAGASATIGTGATLELAAADSGPVTFSGPTGTLVLDHSSTFTGQIFDLTGNGTPTGSDQIDLKDIAFGPGTSVSYAGTSSGGLLTVSDDQNHTANISLAGNYAASTFSLSSDGSGGTIVIDPPANHDLASGALSFGNADAADQFAVTVTPQHGGAGYLGSFVADAADTANGQETVGWHFNFDAGPVTQSVTQSYAVAVADHHADGTSSMVTQMVSVTIAGPGNDAFVFHPGAGSDTIVNATSADTIELDGFSAVANGNQLASLLNAAQTGQPQSLFQSVNGGHDTLIDLGNHDSITLTGVEIADLHASNFIIH
jgi:hypothetical protein